MVGSTIQSPVELVAARPDLPLSAHRFTLDGSNALETHLAVVCDEVRTAVAGAIPRRRLEGLLLGGGYGRGEGGVLRTPTGDRPYNDLEFYVFVTGSVLLADRQFRAPLHDVGEELAPRAGAEIEFKVTSARALRRQSPTMFSYDLLLGHRWLIGEDRLLHGCEHHRDPARIPASEATRLLMNRCSGLLFSRQLLEAPEFGPEAANFVGRNLAKAQLGLGDAVLAMSGHYHWSCRERERRLGELCMKDPPSWLDAVRRHHRSGVEFKLHPQCSTESRRNLAAQHEELRGLAQSVWIWTESIRLDHPLTSTAQYWAGRDRKCPETSPIKNWLINLKTFGPSGALGGMAFHYPRERLLRALVLLLFDWQPGVDSDLLRHVQRLLRTKAETFHDLVNVYRRLWCRFN